MITLDLLQWPAMLASVSATWLLASRSSGTRRIGFWSSMVGNILWTTWAIPEEAYALITMQAALAVLNIRGIAKN